MKALFVLLAAVAMGGIATTTCNVRETSTISESRSAATLPIEGHMPSLGQASEWMNSKPLTDADLRGKVVLVEFWTYSCINWRRQLPFVRAWADKYKSKGLIVIGVHTPEFDFEKNLDLVRLAAKNNNVEYPIVIDTDYSIWNAFNNRYWPALYFVDTQGNIRHHQFGEGDYEQSERVIQQLLGEAGGSGVDNELVSVEPHGAEADADWEDLYSPENYVGYDRTRSFSFPGGAELNRPRVYDFPSRLDLNHWALLGNWTFGHQAITLNNFPGSLQYRFHARDLHVVMGPAAKGASVRFRVTIDGKAPDNAHGLDVNEQGSGIITEPRMYQLIRQSKPISDRTFEIEFFEPGVQIFSFTFG